MRPFSLGIITLVQGLFTTMALIVLADVASPTFNIHGFPDWNLMQAGVAAILLLTTSLALGVVMHTLSRSLLRSKKQLWTMSVLTSPSVQRRIEAIGSMQPIPGGPTYAEILDPETPKRTIRAFEFMHGIEYQILTRRPEVYEKIQVYRDQYRVARAFIVPLVIFAFTLPIWDPLRTLDGAGTIGPFPIIRSQAFLLSVLAAAVCYVAFRERAHRYAAAKTLAYVTVEAADQDRA
jgi:hypothetical protein